MCVVALLLLLTRTSGGVKMAAEAEEASAHLEPADAAGYRTYIVFLEAGVLTDDDDDAAYRAWHLSLLPSETTSLGEPRLRYSYRSLFNGFSARLTADEVKEVARKPGFIRAFPNAIRQLQTTRTPSFLGLPSSLAQGESPDNLPSAGGRGMIVGVVDCGIDDDHPSMNDHGFDRPERWRGSCHPLIKCNRKLIGAKNIIDPGRAPADLMHGHGTHTASTAAGNIVAGTSFNGLASGNASGMAPYAHVAIYKVCISGGCPDAAMLYGIQEAVRDGVDVVSLSIGEASRILTYDNDPVAMASYFAMQRGVPVVAAGGNVGPAASTVVNAAPWLLTVGAGTVDRKFLVEVNVVQGDESLQGESLADRRKLPQIRTNPEDLLYRGDRSTCEYEVDEQYQLRDRIMICEPIPKKPQRTREAARKALTQFNASAFVLISRQGDGEALRLDDLGLEPGLPALRVSYGQGQRLKNLASLPQARGVVDFFISHNDGTVLDYQPAPRVAGFSSRGPNRLTPGILKPDVLAPGVNILAGVVTGVYRERDYAFMSGTSMAAPHVSGIVALMKHKNPTWSPAIISISYQELSLIDCLMMHA